MTEMVGEYDVALARTPSDLPIPCDDIPEPWVENFAALCEHIRTRMQGERPRTFEFIVRVVRDLEELARTSPGQHKTIVAAIRRYPASYGELGEELGKSKVTVFLQVRKAARKMPWVLHLFRKQTPKVWEERMREEKARAKRQDVADEMRKIPVPKTKLVPAGMAVGRMLGRG